MRRIIVAPLLSAIILGALLLPASALARTMVTDGPWTATTPMPTASSTIAATAATASRVAVGAVAQKPASDETSQSATRATTTTRPIRHIRLACARIVAGPAVAPAIGCRWSAVTADTLRGYRLWRVVDGHGPRRLVATVAAGDPLRFVDRNVRRGHAYTYLVVALAKDGSRIGVSHRVTVRVPSTPANVRLACGLVVGDLPGVACRWSEAKAPTTAGYVLYRSVDGAAREAIHRIGSDGRRSFLDRDIERGQTIRYRVVVIDKAGKQIGRSRIVLVRIPPREATSATGTPTTVSPLGA